MGDAARVLRFMEMVRKCVSRYVLSGVEPGGAWKMAEVRVGVVEVWLIVKWYPRGRMSARRASKDGDGEVLEGDGAVGAGAAVGDMVSLQAECIQVVS